jgi:peptide deformylase
MILPIVKWPSAQLKQVSLWVGGSGFPVVRVESPMPHLVPGDPSLGRHLEPQLLDLIEDMRETMVAAGGVGLSAIQVGVPLRIVVTVFKGIETMVNPVILNRGEPRSLVSEGCLSLPGVTEMVHRHDEVKIQYRHPGIKSYLPGPFTLRGLAAQCVQHEVEHLDGKFFLDHVKPARRDAIRAELRQRR